MASNQQQFNQNASEIGMNLNASQSLAGMGQTAVAGLNQAGQVAATNQGNIAIGAGNATAASTLAGAQITSGAINSGVGAISQPVQGAMNAQYMSNLFNPGGTQASVNNFVSANPVPSATLNMPAMSDNFNASAFSGS